MGWSHRDGKSRHQSVPNATVVAMVETKSGALAMGTSSDGLYLLLSNRTVLHFNHANGFPNDWIRCLCEDREGTLWVGAGSVGLIALRPGKIETLDPPDHWQGCVPLSVATTPDGALWVGSEGAGLYRLLDGEWEHFAENAGLSNLLSGASRKIPKAGCGRAPGVAACSFSKAIISSFRPAWKMSMFRCRRFCRRADGVTWIGTASGLIRYENGAVKWFGEKDGLKVPDVRYHRAGPRRHGLVRDARRRSGPLEKWPAGAISQERRAFQ